MREPQEYSDRVTVTLPKRLTGRLKADGSRSGKGVSGIVRDAVERYYAEQPPPPPPSFIGVGVSKKPLDHRKTKEVVGAAIARRHPRRTR